MQTTKQGIGIKEATSAFLANKRIAVTGVSRTPKDAREQHRVQAASRARLRGVRGQSQRPRGRGRQDLPRI